jgi:hypothetical protein
VLAVVKASVPLSMTDLQDIVADATHFVERPIVTVCDAVEEFDA